MEKFEFGVQASCAGTRPKGAAASADRRQRGNIKHSPISPLEGSVSRTQSSGGFQGLEAKFPMCLMSISDFWIGFSIETSFSQTRGHWFDEKNTKLYGPISKMTEVSTKILKAKVVRISGI